MEPVPTEEEAAEYLKQHALEGEEEQILRSRFWGLVDIPCYEMQKLSHESSTM